MPLFFTAVWTVVFLLEEIRWTSFVGLFIIAAIFIQSKGREKEKA